MTRTWKARDGRRPSSTVSGSSYLRAIVHVPLVLKLSTQLVKLQQELLPGYALGVYSCLHGGPIHGLLWAFDKIAETDAANGKQIEVLIVHVCVYLISRLLQRRLKQACRGQGTLDPLVAYADALEIKRRIPHAQLLTIDGAGHDFPVHDDYWEGAVRNIAAFLSS